MNHLMEESTSIAKVSRAFVDGISVYGCNENNVAFIEIENYKVRYVNINEFMGWWDVWLVV